MDSPSPYGLLLTAALQIPIHHYLLGLVFICIAFLYNFLEIHLFGDLFTGFVGQPVALTFKSSSEVYQQVVSKCRILHGRFLSTPWLSSPHLQTAFLSLYARPLEFSYKRQIFILDDGGTIALDWLTHSDEGFLQSSNALSKDDKTPVLIVVPGLTSDSESAYIKQFAYKMAKCGWNVVVSNHRGLGGLSLTSDCCYNAGMTQDIRKIIDHVHHRSPKAPLFLAGCSLGANVVIKYLGEEGTNTPIAGAAAICSPWDLLATILYARYQKIIITEKLFHEPGTSMTWWPKPYKTRRICDRFLNRKAVQQFYNKALVGGLKAYAQLHQTVISRIVDWEGIDKSHVLRDFDNYVTRVAAKYETVDTYYRRGSCCNYVGGVMIPLLCISAIDDPVCSSEAIPFDECRENKNVVLATTQHGGHLAYYEGITADSLWWVRAVHEFLIVLQSSPIIHKKKEAEIQIPQLIRPKESLIDQDPYVNIMEDEMVIAIDDNQILKNSEDTGKDPLAIGDDRIKNSEDMGKETVAHSENNEDIILERNNSDHKMEATDAKDTNVPIRRYMDQISRHSRKSVWLLAYIAIMTTWPLLGSGIAFFWRKRVRKRYPALQKI